MKRVLLVFPRAASGVDGPRPVFTSHPPSLLQRCKETLLQNLIKRAQFAVPNMALMLLSSIEVEGVEQRICDMRFDKLPLHEHWDLVGITVHTGAATAAFEVARQFRQRGMKVVLGGPHVTLFPERCAKEADVIVVGEADDIWQEVLQDLKHNCLKRRYQATELPDLSVPRPIKKKALNIKNYFTTNLIQTSRGCPYRCDFCNVYVMNGGTVRHRPIEHVVAEVERFLKDDKRVFFIVDDTVNADPRYAKELYKRLIPYKIRWVGQATTLLGQQEELLKIFADSGCVGLLIGIESVTDASNHQHRKKQNSERTLARNIKAIRSAGICVYGSFIYGLDGDTVETAQALYDFIEDTHIDVPGINLLRPIPGTALFKRLAEEGRLLFDKDDIEAFRYSWGQEMQCKPKLMSVETFIEAYTSLTKRLYTFPKAIKRAMHAPCIPHIILMFNLSYIYMYGLSRRDLFAQREKLRQGLHGQNSQAQSGERKPAELDIAALSSETEKSIL
ncbi:MAG: radical SAM protein [Chloroherpetonaceae bacterium]|nr:B12-binding domain-containing radical SAM protein [Chloroherpetonaceae bacterium]MCS7210502.1 B12-binding domain-containing radical SAM protein [Chloroherpetonaceae bacterium]MDW8020651.1 radical SAM protein [Chloroherpetonaceae bacterium]MDW8466560.1 radical SAM protein [Chloroherpetonaceae bacterium]